MRRLDVAAPPRQAITEAELREYQQERHRRRAAMVMRQIDGQIPVEHRGSTFENREGPRRRNLERWAEDPGKRFFCVIHGEDVGSGKTHLATAAFRVAAARVVGGQKPYRRPLWMSAEELIDTLELGEFDRAREVMSRVGSTSLLLLDELGRRRNDRLASLICRRYDGHLLTIMTTNFTRADLEEWDPALADRVHDERHTLHLGVKGRSWRRILDR